MALMHAAAMSFRRLIRLHGWAAACGLGGGLALQPAFGPFAWSWAALLMALGLWLQARQRRSNRGVTRARPAADPGWVPQSEAVPGPLLPHDALTGLPSRHVFLDRLHLRLVEPQAEDEGVAVLCIELVEHASIARNQGGVASDLLLRHASARLLANLRQDDMLARIERARFAIALNELVAPGDILALCARLQATMATPFDLYGQASQVTLQFGVALYRAEADAAAAPASGDLLARAVAALELARQDGVGAVRASDEQLDLALRRQRALTEDLRQALARSELELRFMPQFSLAERQLVGVQVHLAWSHPSHGEIGAQQLQALAEAAGIGRALGGWLAEAAFREVASWPVDQRQPIDLTIGLLACQLDQPDLAEVLTNLRQAHGLAAARVVLAIDEAALGVTGRGRPRSLARLQAAGFRLACADFGASGGQLAAVARLGVDQLLIDIAALEGRLGSMGATALLRTTGMLCRELGIAMAALALADERRHGQAMALGCSRGQGDHFSSLLPTLEMRAIAACAAPAPRAASAQPAAI